MENLEINSNFWSGRSVFLTGHTGFKGGWMALWLSEMGAKVHGYSLDPCTEPNFYNETNLREKLTSSTIADIQNIETLKSSLINANPSIVIHMAAQSLVHHSYINPLETYKTNVIGTLNLFEVLKKIDSVKVLLNVTSDKCYQNNEQLKPYSENDRLGGYDPYSNSKACSELISVAYRNSFFREIGLRIATVRAGNVIGGGDWSMNRLIPDFFRATDSGEKLFVRSPNAVRPWQHVLEPILGYLLLAEKLYNLGENYEGAWNFGPLEYNFKNVSWIINYLCQKFLNVEWSIDKKTQPHEANLLFLDSSKARLKLNWNTRWPIELCLDKIIEWHQALKEKKNMSEISISQIKSYEDYLINKITD